VLYSLEYSCLFVTLASALEQLARSHGRVATSDSLLKLVVAKTRAEQRGSVSDGEGGIERECSVGSDNNEEVNGAENNGLDLPSPSSRVEAERPDSVSAGKEQADGSVKVVVD